MTFMLIHLKFNFQLLNVCISSIFRFSSNTRSNLEQMLLCFYNCLLKMSENNLFTKTTLGDFSSTWFQEYSFQLGFDKIGILVS
jgi:hypothetical protein